MVKMRARAAYWVTLKIIAEAWGSNPPREPAAQRIAAHLTDIVWWTTEPFANDHTLSAVGKGKEIMTFIMNLLSFTKDLALTLN